MQETDTEPFGFPHVFTGGSTSGGGYFGANIGIVPEPAPLALLGFGVTALVAPVARRRAKHEGIPYAG